MGCSQLQNRPTAFSHTFQVAETVRGNEVLCGRAKLSTSDIRCGISSTVHCSSRVLSPSAKCEHSIQEAMCEFDSWVLFFSTSTLARILAPYPSHKAANSPP